MVDGFNLHSGHWISGRFSSTLFVEDNVRPQCRICNFYFYGKSHIFGEKLRKEIGEKRIKNLIELSKQTKQFTVAELKEIIKKYQ